MIVSRDLLGKRAQLSSIGLSLLDLNNLSEILLESHAAKFESAQIDNRELYKYEDNTNFGGFVNITDVPAYAVTYNLPTENFGQCNMIGIQEPFQQELMGYSVPNPIYVMNNSVSNLSYTSPGSEGELPESTKSSRKNTMSSADDSKSGPLPKTGMISGQIGLLRKVLEGIHDDYQILITSKPKNKSNKIRKSNRHSRYRGVSLNGKKWQVMIMGPIKKKYFGGIATEREAAVFYDKLSILTNGLSAKTNFNYRKCDLMKMMAELEYMETQVS